MKKDPVCRRVLDVREATVVSRYRDRYYYFCSLRCRDAFLQTPNPVREVAKSKAVEKIPGPQKDSVALEGGCQ